MRVLLVLAAILGANVAAERAKIAKTDAARLEVSPFETIACSPETCENFEVGEEQKCSCSAYLDDTELSMRLLKRLLSTLTDILQVMRKTSDKLTSGSGTFSKLWWGSAIGHAQKDLKFFQEGLSYVKPLAVIAEAKVKDLTELKAPAECIEAPATAQCFAAAADFKAPAAVHPIVIEIWDDNTFSPQQFIGETGMDLIPGELGRMTSPLELNTHQTHSWVNPGSATVTFSTKLVTTGPNKCAISGFTSCVHFDLTVWCHSASALPNTDTGIAGDVTDAYCKVRVKGDPDSPSQKFKTAVVPNSLDPTFEAMGEGSPGFRFQWDSPVMLPVPTNPEPEDTLPPESDFVSDTLDNMAIHEILTAEVTYLAAHVFFAEGACKSRFSHACGLLAKLNAATVDTAALKQLSKEAEAEAVAAPEEVDPVVEAASETSPVGEASLFEVDTSEGAQLHNYHRSAKKRKARREARARNGAYTGYSDGGGGGDGAGSIILVVIVLVFVCAIAF